MITQMMESGVILLAQDLKMAIHVDLKNQQYAQQFVDSER